MENLKNGTEMIIQIYKRKLIYEGSDNLIDKETSKSVEVQWLIATTIEILSEEDEEIDIQALNQYGTNFHEGIISTRSSDTEKEKEFRKYIVNNAKDIRTLIRVVKQLDKKIKEKE